MRRTIRLREGELRRMISESVKRILIESGLSTDTLQSAYGKAKDMGMYDMNKVLRKASRGPVYDDESVDNFEKNSRRLRQARTFGNELEKRYGDEIEQNKKNYRDTNAYNIAYNFCQNIIGNGKYEVPADRGDVYELASYIKAETRVPINACVWAVLDYLEEEMNIFL